MDNSPQQTFNEHNPHEPITAKPQNNLLFAVLLSCLVIILSIIALGIFLLLRLIYKTTDTSTSIKPVVLQIPSITPSKVVQIKGSGMMPNFRNDEYYSVDRNFYQTNPVLRGDVVIYFRSPDEYRLSIEYIKRVVGIPGDTLKISGGNVFLNGNLFSEAYLATDTQTTLFPGSKIQEGVEFIIPPDQYFVLGDNRTHSSDSREYGPIPRKNIIGKIMAMVKNYTPPTFSPEQREIRMKTDLRDSISQKIELLKVVKDLCSVLPIFQIPQLSCVINNGESCNLNMMTVEQLQEASQLEETAINDCVKYQAEVEAKRSKNNQ